MKLAAAYTVFNGTELLAGSIEQIIDHVDVVLICFQNTSNKGEHNPDLEKTLAKVLPNTHKLEFLHFSPNLEFDTKTNELNKHNEMKAHLNELECTHFVVMACDHYYKGESFLEAKKTALEGDYDVTFSEMYTYYKRQNWRLDPIEDYMMPFIIKLHPAGMFRRSANYPQRVDPSVKWFPCEHHYTFKRNELMLHHLSMVRVDVENKFRNAAASVNWSPERVKQFISEYENAQPGDSISYFKGRNIVEVVPPFEINL